MGDADARRDLHTDALFDGDVSTGNGAYGTARGDNEVMATRETGIGQTRKGGRAFKPVDLSGSRSAYSIRASGMKGRDQRPNTCLQ
jgi:hypothetical protein